jgi:hypothetical protein
VYNPNKIYEFQECDTLSRYPNDKITQNFLKLQKWFFKIVEYPEDFEFRNEKILILDFSRFILYKDGHGGELKQRQLTTSVTV